MEGSLEVLLHDGTLNTELPPLDHNTVQRILAIDSEVNPLTIGGTRSCAEDEIVTSLVLSYHSSLGSLSLGCLLTLGYHRGSRQGNEGHEADP